ncbi:MAG: formate C-acetyltransferase [Chloroflexi bacterium]|nr:formate C-acetyltransferase [Chloroflexota bacterium]
MNSWRGFKGENWRNEINVRDFISQNYTPYDGDDTFLCGPTARTTKLNNKYLRLKEVEKEWGGVLDIDTSTVSSLLNYRPGYLDKDNEIIVGLQTNRPLKRGVNPFGGMRMAEQACKAYGYDISDKIKELFAYRTTHNDGVFRVYTDEMKLARKYGIITGLPDAYGRGRIIGDYRRVALYGVDFIIEKKKADMQTLGQREMDDENIRLREDVFRQIDFLDKLKQMAQDYGYDISSPAKNAKEATQWLYFAYLASIKEQNGAAMSLGRTSTFLDIYFERDLAEGALNEQQAQEIFDDFVLKLRMARTLRTPDYNELFAGDPMWITESVAGMSTDGCHMVTKSSMRMLNTLYNLQSAPEPNLTVLWSDKLPENFKRFCAKVSIQTDSIQFENDDLMRKQFGDDYAIACCVSAAKVGKQMQFFGARANIVKVLLMALNGGRDEISGEQVGPLNESVPNGQILNYNDVIRRFQYYCQWFCKLYVNTMNVIHYMHDKYAYEKIQMALHDTDVQRFMSFGMAGLSVAVDSLSAIKYAKVTPLKDERGLVYNFNIEGDFPKFGNDDDRVDSMAVDLCSYFMTELQKHHTYRNAEHTLSILTITSNVVYGQKTGATPDGGACGQPFAPGANPMHGREKEGALASLNSVAKLPYDYCKDGISCTFTITPSTIGGSLQEQEDNLLHILDGYFKQSAHHLNVNVLNQDQLLDAMENPDKYPNLTIRVSGYAVNFNALSHQQQMEVIARTFHNKM